MSSRLSKKESGKLESVPLSAEERRFVDLMKHFDRLLVQLDRQANALEGLFSLMENEFNEYKALAKSHEARILDLEAAASLEEE